jgi:transporter family-2 protein
MNMLMIILSLIGGALLSVQAAVNGRLGAQVPAKMID